MSETEPENHRRGKKPAPKRRSLPAKALGSIAILAVLALLAAAPLLYLNQTGSEGEQVAMPDPEPKPVPVEPLPPIPDEVATPTQPDSTDTPDPEVAVSGWNTLLTGASEADGYGLYSYLLIPVNDEASRPRYLAAVKALRRHMDPVADVERAGFKKYEINITYLPVRGALPQDADAKLLLDQYDFARAKRILGYVGEGSGLGPYLVSHLEPVSGRPPSRSRLLVQDLGWVPADLAALWVADFTDEVKSPRTWDQTTLTEVMLVSRTFVAVTAESFEIGVEAAERFVSLKKALAAE